MMLSLGGPVVSMTAFQDMLMVVYHKSGTFHGDQNLACIIYDVKNGFKTRELPYVSISPSSTLGWIGADDRGMFFSYDSSGVLRVLHHSHWVPILDTRKARGAKAETYWPVGLTETQMMCVVCKVNFFDGFF